MGQSYGCGHESNDKILNLTLEIWCEALRQHLFSPERDQPPPLITSAQRINQKETKNSEKRSNPNQIILY